MMDTNVFLIILLATVMHAVWNGMVKKHPDKVVAVSGIVFGHVPVSIIAIILLPAPSVDCIPYIIASALIHQGYNWYLLSSYKIGDLTKVYPIARGFGPLVATIISILILGLVFDNLIILSIALICLGIMILGIFDKEGNNSFPETFQGVLGTSLSCLTILFRHHTVLLVPLNNNHSTQTPKYIHS